MTQFEPRIEHITSPTPGHRRGYYLQVRINTKQDRYWMNKILKKERKGKNDKKKVWKQMKQKKIIEDHFEIHVHAP